ncbi:MAG: hypothetical protein ACK418_20500 [Pseudomonas sp.]
MVRSANVTNAPYLESGASVIKSNVRQIRWLAEFFKVPVDMFI